jgi:FixJ family two-component response regulator
MEPAPVIHIVDDDAGVLRSLARLLGAAGHRCATHGDATGFLAGHDPDVPGCAILDLGLPGMDAEARAARVEDEAVRRNLARLTRANARCSTACWRAG